MRQEDSKTQHKHATLTHTPVSQQISQKMALVNDYSLKLLSQSGLLSDQSGDTVLPRLIFIYPSILLIALLSMVLVLDYFGHRRDERAWEVAFEYIRESANQHELYTTSNNN